MLRSTGPVQQEMETVLFDRLVPRDHLVRKIAGILDTDFTRAETAKLYRNRGRPAIDPVVIFKTLLQGYLFGIRSERRVVQEIEVNVAYRWFLGLQLTDPVPHALTIGRNGPIGSPLQRLGHQWYDLGRGAVAGRSLFSENLRRRD